MKTAFKVGLALNLLMLGVYVANRNWNDVVDTCYILFLHLVILALISEKENKAHD